MKKVENLYKYGVSPLELPTTLNNGDLYASSRGDIVRYNGNGELETIIVSPLSSEIENNFVENLTALQLELYWTICKNKMYDSSDIQGE